MNDLQPIADRKTVLDVDQSEQALGIPVEHIADVEAAPRLRMAAQVVLPFVLVVPLVEAVGVAAIGQAFEFAKQTGIEGTPGGRVIDGPPIDLNRARHVVGRLGTPLDLQ